MTFWAFSMVSKCLNLTLGNKTKSQDTDAELFFSNAKGPLRKNFNSICTNSSKWFMILQRVGIQQFVSNIDWSFLNNISDVDKTCQAFYDKLNLIFDDHTAKFHKKESLEIKKVLECLYTNW